MLHGAVHTAEGIVSNFAQKRATILRSELIATGSMIRHTRGYVPVGLYLAQHLPILEGGRSTTDEGEEEQREPQHRAHGLRSVTGVALGTQDTFYTGHTRHL